LNDRIFRYKPTEEISSVRKIISDVRRDGDRAIKKYTLKFDKVVTREIKVSRREIKQAYSKIDKKTIFSIKSAAGNIEKFAKRQLRQFKDFEFEIVPGVFTGQKIIPLGRVGVYVPAGRFPLVSSLIMCAIPARVAGVKEITVCSPPAYNGSINPAILIAADMIGIKEIYKVGGVQAIAALGWGTESIRRVDKIVGPGNKFVTYAKKELFGAVGIDFIAGPTEIMIIADESANPKILAADLLAQAEHDIEAVPILLTNSLRMARNVKNEMARQMSTLCTKDIAKKSIKKNGLIILVKNIDEAIYIANKKAPEHLQLQIKNPGHYIKRLTNYGTLFIGENSAEVLGDYSSGINHTLPTNTCARYTGGLGVKDFIKIQTTLRITKQGLKTIGPIAKKLAEIEGLSAHAASITIRMENNVLHAKG